jgi:hypothetical protein
VGFDSSEQWTGVEASFGWWERTPPREENAMARAFQFDVEKVVDQLNRILQMELAAVIYYTHYSAVRSISE